MSTFPVYAIDAFEWIEEERIGSKDSSWYRVTTSAPGLESGEWWIYKTPKRFRGEIWAEKIASEIGQRMGLPTARVELARDETESDAINGTISLNFADPHKGRTLEHGNELMDAQARVRSYARHEKDESLALDAVFDYLNENEVRAPLDATSPDEGAAFYFTGYLVFDALIGNVDRHHQNWGAVKTGDGALHLAPTFDHGASLGRELGTRKRRNYLNNKQVDHYVAKGRAKIPPPGQNDRIALFKLLDFLPQLDQTHALCFWLDQALKIDAPTLAGLFDRLPRGLADREAQEFARTFLDHTRDRIATLREEICS